MQHSDPGLRVNASVARPTRDDPAERHAVQVDLVTPSQHESLVDLLCELHTYYNQHASVPRDLVRTYLIDTLLAPTRHSNWSSRATKAPCSALQRSR